MNDYTSDTAGTTEPKLNYAIGPYRAEGWEGLVVNDSHGNTLALAPAAHLGLAPAKATARLFAASWSMRQALGVIVNDERIAAWMSQAEPQAFEQCCRAFELTN